MCGFRLASEKSPNEVVLASGCEWEWVAKCCKIYTECFEDVSRNCKLLKVNYKEGSENQEINSKIGQKYHIIACGLVAEKAEFWSTSVSAESQNQGLAMKHCVNGSMYECLDSMLWSQGSSFAKQARKSRSVACVREYGCDVVCERMQNLIRLWGAHLINPRR